MRNSLQVGYVMCITVTADLFKDFKAVARLFSCVIIAIGAFAFFHQRLRLAQNAR